MKLLRLAAVMLCLIGCTSQSRAQNVLQQLGPQIPLHTVMSYPYGGPYVVDAGGSTQNGQPAANSVNPNTMPLGYAWVNSGLGDTGFSGYANGTFSTLSRGFDGSNNAIEQFNGFSLWTALNGASLPGMQLLGTPTAPTPVFGDNSTKIATTNYVRTAIAGGVSAALPFINAAAFNIPVPPADGTSAAQTALNAAQALAPAIIYFPSAFNFTKLSTYPGVFWECQGPGQMFKRTAVGYGVILADAVGHTYMQSTPTIMATEGGGPSFNNCAFNGQNLDGTNLMMDSALNSRFNNLISINSGATSAQGLGSTAGATLTVASVTTGALVAGQQLVGVGFGVSGNTYATIEPFGTGGTSGTGAAGTYALSASVGTVSSRKFTTLSNWQFINADGTATLPSANVSFVGSTAIGGVFNNSWTGGYVGNSNQNDTGCLSYSGAGIYADTTDTGGSNKLNQNGFHDINMPCNTVAVLLANGADNQFDGLTFEWDAMGAILGSGTAGAARNVFNHPYCEGAANVMGDCFQVGSGSTGNQVYDIGSGNNVTTIVENFGGYTSVKLDNHLAYFSDSIIDDFNSGDLNNSATLPIPRYSQAGGHTLVGKAGAGASELAVVSWTTGSVAYVHGGHGNGTVQSPTPVTTNDILSAFNGYGQYDTTIGHLGDGAEIDVFAGSLWTASNFESGLKFYTTAHNATSGNLAMTIGSNQSTTLAGTLGIPLATWTDTQTCTAGQISVDTGFLYVCTAANTVKRAALSSF